MMKMNLKQKEKSFLTILTQIHKDKGADWVNIKHLRKILFGDAMNERILHRDRCRIYSIANSLQKQDKIKVIKKQMVEAPIGRVLESYVQLVGYVK
jgi:hypothetical protein